MVIGFWFFEAFVFAFGVVRLFRVGFEFRVRIRVRLIGLGLVLWLGLGL